MKIFCLLAIVAALVVAASAQYGCYCPTYYAPVCSVRGITYANICRMHCARAVFSHYGVCAQG